MDPRASGGPSTIECNASGDSLSVQIVHETEPGEELVLTTRVEDWDRVTGDGNVTQVQYVEWPSTQYEFDRNDTDCEIVALPNTPNPGALVVSTRCTVVNPFDGRRGEISFNARCTAPL